MFGYILFFVAVAALPVAWRVSGGRAAARYRLALERLEAEVRSGEIGGDGEAAPPEVKAVRQRLAAGWRPVRGGSPEILSGLARFLQTAVVKPLVQSLHARGRGARSRVRQALDAIEDIEFYAEVPVLERASADLAKSVERVAREYGKTFKVDVKLDLPESASCRIDEDALKDVVYLILDNGGRHGCGAPLEVSLRTDGGTIRLVVRDSGEGFSDQALERAEEPFFSTVPGSLGLGLTHARHVVRAHGGTLTVRNARNGGAEVEVRLPASAE